MIRESSFVARDARMYIVVYDVVTLFHCYQSTFSREYAYREENESCCTFAPVRTRVLRSTGNRRGPHTRETG